MSGYTVKYVHVPAALDMTALIPPNPIEPVAAEPDPHAENRALIRQHSMELCELVTNFRAKSLPLHGALVELKYSGWRALWIRGELVTRTGATLWSSAHLWPALRELESRFGKPMMFDGEYVVNGSFAATCAECAGAKSAGAPTAGSGAIWLFDAVPMAVWEGLSEGLPLLARKHALADMLLRPLARSGVHVVGHTIHGSFSFIEKAAIDAYFAGYEGIVVKDPNSLHRSGRSNAWQRLKRKLTLDLPVVGYGELKRKAEGVRGGIPDGILGHIVVENDGKAIKVGVGWAERERALLWHHPERMIGRIAEIEAMEITDSGSLRQPRFLGWREDK